MEQKGRAAETVPESMHARLAHEVMRKQAALSLSIAAVFLLILFGLPLFNYMYPDAAGAQIYGFPRTWLFLGILFYPLTWLLSWVFITASDRIEAQCADWRTVLGEEAGEPLEPEGVGDVMPAFIEDARAEEMSDE